MIPEKPSPKAAPPPRGRPPLDEMERKHILESTTAVFLEKGFLRASTNEIARRAQTSKQTLYALFPTKAELFAGVMGVHMERLFSRHAYYIESGKTPRRTLNEIGCRILTMFSAPEFLALYRIMVAEVHRFPDLARQLWRECMQRGRGLLAESLRAHRIGAPGYQTSAAQFISFVLGDFLIEAMLNPDLRLGKPIRRARVRKAVDDFLKLHPEQAPSKRNQAGR
jgi:AcrR family transcriptional regulator